MEISKELKCQIETNQNQLKTAIREHQTLYNRLKETPDDPEIQHKIDDTQQTIILIGLEQKVLVERLRKEYKQYQKSLKICAVKNGIEERRYNLSTALSRARKQHIIARSLSTQSSPPNSDTNSPEPSVAGHTNGTGTRSSSTTPPLSFSQQQQPQASASTACVPGVSGTLTPPSDQYGNEADLTPLQSQTGPLPTLPHDVTQTIFLTYFGLATHEIYKEMQNRRAERKRRSTANPQFLYTKGWDMSKRKRNFYLASSISPPQTRQSTKTKANTVNNSASTNSNVNANIPSNGIKANSTAQQAQYLQNNNNRGDSPPIDVKQILALPSIPNLPSGLTITAARTTPNGVDTKICIECRLPGNLSICELCSYGFHVSCHNRPLVQPPRHCPKCYKDIRSNLQSPIEIIHLPDTNGKLITEKLKVKTELLERNKELTAGLTQLQDKHSQLTIRLKAQDTERDQLVKTQTKAEDKIQQILKFIAHMKDGTKSTGGIEITQIEQPSEVPS